MTVIKLPFIMLILLTASFLAEAGAADNLWVFVGTYTQKNSKGIYRFEMDLASGKLSNRTLVAETTSPSFLAISPDHTRLFAVNEIGNFKGKKSGAISAFALDAKQGTLKFINQQPSLGGGPCHIVTDKAGRHVLAANYGGGSVCVLPVDADGRLGQAAAFVQHKGSSVNPSRQKRPHAHSITLDRANRFAFAADLGLDKVLVYHFDPKAGTLTPNKPDAAKVAPGSGPRHFAFHPTGQFAYVINEMKSTVTAFRYDAKKGTLNELQTITTLPKGFKGGNSTAEVQVHPSGKFLYGSNRGHNSIVVYTIDPKTGRLQYVENQGSEIKTPRNFGIDPTGQYLLVANQSSDSLVVFRIDASTGALKPTGNKVEVPVPVCVKMIAKP